MTEENEEDVLGTAKRSVTVVGELVKAAGDTPEAKEAGRNLGATAVTITKALNNVLLPLAAINFGFEKAREYFNNRFQQDLNEKVAGIPPENFIEPKASIAGPTLQGLAFAHEEPDLKEMYLQLLANSMDSRHATSSHPSFVEVIKQLDAKEACLLKKIMAINGLLAIAKIHLHKEGQEGYQIAINHLTNYVNEESKEPTIEPRLPTMFENWARLGLVEISYQEQVASQDAYKWIHKRPEFKALKKKHEKSKDKLIPEKGCVRVTEFGKRFGKAVGIFEDPQSD